MSNESIADDFRCPSCGTENKSGSSSWEKVGYVPIICVKCTNLFWARLSSSKHSELAVVNRVPVFKVQIPELSEGTWVFIINRQHDKHLEPGVVTKRDHKHYRVKFTDGAQLWVPQHWVERIPWKV